MGEPSGQYRLNMSDARCGKGFGSREDMEGMKIDVVDSCADEVDDKLRLMWSIRCHVTQCWCLTITGNTNNVHDTSQSMFKIFRWTRPPELSVDGIMLRYHLRED